MNKIHFRLCWRLAHMQNSHDEYKKKNFSEFLFWFNFKYFKTQKPNPRRVRSKKMPLNYFSSLESLETIEKDTFDFFWKFWVKYFTYFKWFCQCVIHFGCVFSIEIYVIKICSSFYCVLDKVLTNFVASQKLTV